MTLIALPLAIVLGLIVLAAVASCVDDLAAWLREREQRREAKRAAREAKRVAREHSALVEWQERQWYDAGHRRGA